MFTRIEFRSRQLRRLAFYIKPDIDFGIVLAALEDVSCIGDESAMVHIRFALLELVNNSLRAHRSESVEDPIFLEFQIIQNQSDIGDAKQIGLRIVLEDHGRGFDPSDLPYNLFGPVDTVDLQSDSFQLYREMHNQQRFGMGLFITKRTFDSFRLEFIDFNENTTPYNPGKIRGTRISLIHWGGNHE